MTVMRNATQPQPVVSTKFTVTYTSPRCTPDAVMQRKTNQALSRKKPTSPTTAASSSPQQGAPVPAAIGIDLNSTRHRRLALYLLLHEARRYQQEVGLSEHRVTEYMLRRCRPTPPPAILSDTPYFRQLLRDALELQQPRCMTFPDGNYGQSKVELAQRNIWANPSF